MCKSPYCPIYEHRKAKGITKPCDHCEYVKRFERTTRLSRIGLIGAVVIFIITTYLIY